MNIEEMGKAYKLFNESKVNTLGHRFGIEDFMENTINELKDIKNKQNDCIDKIAGIERQLTEFFKVKYQEQKYYHEKQQDDDEYMDGFMSMSINQHKDYIDKIARLEKQLAELIKADDKEILKGEDYHYEPNE